jgi:hypothetical protein
MSNQSNKQAFPVDQPLLASQPPAGQYQPPVVGVGQQVVPPAVVYQDQQQYVYQQQQPQMAAPVTVIYATGGPSYERGTADCAKIMFIIGIFVPICGWCVFLMCTVCGLRV